MWIILGTYTIENNNIKTYVFIKYFNFELDIRNILQNIYLYRLFILNLIYSHFTD